jgi:hypothetical protein
MGRVALLTHFPGSKLPGYFHLLPTGQSPSPSPSPFERRPKVRILFSLWERSISIFGFVFHRLVFWKHALLQDTGYKNVSQFSTIENNMFADP